ncbi:MAG: sugar phosphate isomerase/epimerase [Bacteroidales bacterium]|nr:sugar phosphate isomerase/epimerase [Bacteroidales bacterium]MBN2633447.1 sugar phosphate isomerase/epimerase [Bacteroidales bacterium]
MKLGISSYSYTWAVGVPGHMPSVTLDETDLLDRAEELNVKLVQIADNMPLHKMTESQLDNLVLRASDLGIELETGANKMTPQNLQQYIGIAERMKSPILRFVIDGEDFRPDVPDIISIVRDAEPELRKKQIILAIENHDRLFTSQFVEIIESVASDHVGICLDCANSLGVGEGIREVVSSLAPYAVNFHLKEVSIRRKYHKMGFDIEGKPFGEGNLPLQWILSMLPGKCRTAILEQWTPPEESLEKTIAKEKMWAEKSISYLKKYFKA